jgi:hypothetical protein
MLDSTSTTFSHVKSGATEGRSEGLRDFLQYQDPGAEGATGSRVLAQRVHAHRAPEKGTGWHRHGADFHILFDYSPDMEYIEIVSPADSTSIEIPAPSAVPEAKAW